MIREATDRPVTFFTALVPVRPDRVDALRETLRALPVGADSPFEAAAGTHFGRLVVVDHLGATGQRAAVALEPPRLLVAVNCDGDAGAYLGGLCLGFGATADRIWSECDGYPGAGDPTAFVEWIRSYEVAPTLAFATVEATVERIRTAVVDRDRLSAFAVRAQHLDPAALRQAWKEEFGW